MLTVKTEKLTQPQILWHMQMSRLINDIEVFRAAECHWQGIKDGLGRSKSKKATPEAYELAKRNVTTYHQKTSEAEDALVEWVKAHPYPSGDGQADAV